MLRPFHCTCSWCLGAGCSSATVAPQSRHCTRHRAPFWCRYSIYATLSLSHCQHGKSRKWLSGKGFIICSTLSWSMSIPFMVAQVSLSAFYGIRALLVYRPGISAPVPGCSLFVLVKLGPFLCVFGAVIMAARVPLWLYALLAALKHNGAPCVRWRPSGAGPPLFRL